MYLSNKSRLLLLLSSLATPFSVTGAEAQQTPLQYLGKESSSPCSVRAWVRVPDLVPGESIEGDTRIKLEGDCPNVESYSLGLRFKERMFWKIRNPGAPLPEKPKAEGRSTMPRFPPTLDIWKIEPDHRSLHKPEHDENAWNEYESAVKSKEHWDIHEEERVAFETKTSLTATRNNGEVPRVLVQSFSLLVPYTNYPPATDYRMNPHPRFWALGDLNIVNTESVYEYFAEIKWSNGTCQEVPAGITAFASFVQQDFPRKEALTIFLDDPQPAANDEVVYDNLRSNYSAEIEIPDELQFQLEIWFLTRGLRLCAKSHRHDLPIWFKACYDEYMLTSGIPRQKHDVDGVVEVTVSFPISIPLLNQDPMFVNFISYYDVHDGRLSVNLQVKRDEGEPPSVFERGYMTRIAQTPLYDEDDQEWLPWSVTRTQIYPPIASPKTVHGHVSWSAPSLQTDPTREPPVHYLSPTGNIRAPIFIDPKMVDELRALSLEERDKMAPTALPRVSVTPQGEESPERYLVRKDTVYVGETWAKKMRPKLPGQSQGLKLTEATWNLIRGWWFRVYRKMRFGQAPCPTTLVGCPGKESV
ncbi:hypothetical protein BS17DRAFT_767251 [Gyrodon lividus]|nr:hypothetical protein BS17DRAFT_767251 [Gyrodon lividus]